MIAHAGIAEHVGIVVTVMVAAVVYGRAWGSAPDASVRRPLAGAVAAIAFLVSTSSPVESLAQGSFSGHMLQHLLMISVVAPLVVYAEPVDVIRRALRRSGRPIRVTERERRCVRWGRSAGPLVAPAVFVGVLFVTHLTSIYDTALEVRIVHDVEHLAYLGAAVLLWSVVRGVGRVDAVRRIGAVFAVIAGSAMLGVVLISANTPLVATYEARLGTADALSDQRVAASLMWVGGMATSLPLLILAFWRWASAEERVARHSERLSDRDATIH